MKKQKSFKSIYINDTTHIMDCTSPYHKKGEPFRPEMIRESVKEVAGLADAHFFQLAHGRVPWYQSKIYPMKEHMAWWSEHFEVPMETLNGLQDINGFVRDGGDVLQEYINACREFNQAAFLSLRMNDEHHIEWCNKKGHLRGIHSISRFLVEHQQFLLGNDLGKWSDRALNWKYSEVRETLFEMIAEQLENYDIDGFDMDFIRYPDLFDSKQTPYTERVEIMENFFTRVRRKLDETERLGKHRYLSIRLPSKMEILDSMGVIPEHLAGLGIEIVNISSSYFTDQWVDFQSFRDRFADVSLFFEICHCTTTGIALNNAGYDNFRFRRATANEIYTTAQMAYHHGADGMSFFNFVYYREHGSEGRGPFNPPPFEVIGKIKDRDFINTAPQHFFLAKGWSAKSQLMPMLAADTDYSFEMNAEEAGIPWDTDFCFRIMTRTPIADRTFRLVFNGVVAEPIADLSEPFKEDEQYSPMHGDKETSFAWRIPLSAMVNGKNRFILKWTSQTETKEEIRVDYMDLFPRKDFEKKQKGGQNG